jgi:hypothetical protein
MALIRDFEPTRRDWQARFETLRTADGRPLAPCLRAELMRECRRLRQVMEMIAEVEAEQKEVVAFILLCRARWPYHRASPSSPARPLHQRVQQFLDARRAATGSASIKYVQLIRPLFLSC